MTRITGPLGGMSIPCWSTGSACPASWPACSRGYALFFLQQNLLQVNVVVYFLPILSMVVTLILIRRQVYWDDLPGVDRLFAFIVLVTMAFLIVLALVKLRIWVIFGGSMFTLFIMAVICYLVLKTCFNILAGKRSAQRRYY